MAFKFADNKKDEWFGKDKLEHLIISILGSVFIGPFFILFGIFRELYDGFGKNRFGFSFKDLFWDVIGVFLGSSIFFIFINIIFY